MVLLVPSRALGYCVKSFRWQSAEHDAPKSPLPRCSLFFFSLAELFSFMHPHSRLSNFIFFPNDVCFLPFSDHQPVSFLPSHIFPPVMNSSFSSYSSSSLPSPTGYLPISVLSFDLSSHVFSMHAENFSFTHNPYSVHIHARFLIFTYSTTLIIYHLKKKFTMTAFYFLSLWVIPPWISSYIRLPLPMYAVWISHQDVAVYDFLQSLVDFPTKCQS